MMKQTEDAREKIGVGTGVDLLSCACIISLPFHLILLSVNSTRTPLSVSCCSFAFIHPALLVIWAGCRPHTAVSGVLARCPPPVVMAVTVFVVRLLRTGLWH
jgi:hypothetical protein